MKNAVTKFFFMIGVASYLAFAVDDSRSIGMHDYRTHAIVIPLLGILWALLNCRPIIDKNG